MKKHGTSEGNQLWGIYGRNQERADTILTVIEAPTKFRAKAEAARLGFHGIRVRPVKVEQLDQAQWLPSRRLKARLHRLTI